MDLGQYAERIQHQLAVAADAAGDEARELAARLAAPLDAAIRLTLQEALSAAAEEITTELAPGSVELRLRGRDVELVVTRPPADPLAPSIEDGGEGVGVAAARDRAFRSMVDADDGTMSRINLRLPDHLKARVEQAAAQDGLSTNAWLVRAAAWGVERGDAHRE